MESLPPNSHRRRRVFPSPNRPHLMPQLAQSRLEATGRKVQKAGLVFNPRRNTRSRFILQVAQPSVLTHLHRLPNDIPSLLPPDLLQLPQVLVFHFLRQSVRADSVSPRVSAMPMTVSSFYARLDGLSHIATLFLRHSHLLISLTNLPY